jgi:hypothetical protein
MSLPVTFDNVPYFGNEYRGDLVITHGVIYYFPHTNVSLEKKKNAGYDAIPGFASHFGLLSLPFLLLGALIKELRSTINEPKLRKLGLWKDGESSQALQSRLDAHIAQVKQQPPQLTQFEYSLPKPMRFAHAEIKNLSTRGGLRFDTEYDSHDFSIGFSRKKLLRESISEAGFTQA